MTTTYIQDECIKYDDNSKINIENNNDDDKTMMSMTRNSKNCGFGLWSRVCCHCICPVLCTERALLVPLFHFVEIRHETQLACLSNWCRQENVTELTSNTPSLTWLPTDCTYFNSPLCHVFYLELYSHPSADYGSISTCCDPSFHHPHLMKSHYTYDNQIHK